MTLLLNLSLQFCNLSITFVCHIFFALINVHLKELILPDILDVLSWIIKCIHMHASALTSALKDTFVDNNFNRVK